MSKWNETNIAEIMKIFVGEHFVYEELSEEALVFTKDINLFDTELNITLWPNGELVNIEASTVIQIEIHDNEYLIRGGLKIIDEDGVEIYKELPRISSDTEIVVGLNKIKKAINLIYSVSRKLFSIYCL